MWVKTSQLKPNCILLADVIGKTGQPIIPKNTVLTDQHIQILKHFLIEHVQVSPQLSDGQTFTPQFIGKPENANKENEQQSVKEPHFLSFYDHYQMVVTNYKDMFLQWQNGFSIDMSAIRKLLLPLFDRITEIGSEVYSLHHYATKENYFYHHCIAVGLLAVYLSEKMNYEQGDQIQIGLAASLSDCGMAQLKTNIYLQDRQLTSKERKEIVNHPVYSYKMVKNISTLTRSAKLAILQHHERIDQSGYPLGLAEEKIHLFARIIAVCDMYHAMTCERAYQSKQSPFTVVEEFQTQKFSQLDPAVVQIFIEGLTNFSIGTKVRLSNNQIGEIVFVHSKKPTRPIIRLKDQQFIAMETAPELFIKEIISH